MLPEFAALCDDLARIASKELQGEALNQMDAELIRGYGERIAHFHFYEGNAYETRDDFPVVTELFISSDGEGQGEMLYAGLGRPEALFVIIEVDGKPVLHRGAVLAYREFRRPLGKPLDDETWRQEIKSLNVPEPPRFTTSFRAR